MPEELGEIINNLKNVNEESFGDLKIYKGFWRGNNNNYILISLAWSGWGKVSAARAATRLISTNKKNKLDFLVFTGVAGAMKKDLNQWDIIIADSVIQHDMDARPFFDKFVIPSLGEKFLKPPISLNNDFYNAIKKQSNLKKNWIFGNVKKGTIGTGDMFISDDKKIESLLNQIPDLLAIEMEGAAVAQVACQEKVDWALLRVISDGADSSASEDFPKFLENYKKHSWDLIESYLNYIST